MKLKTTGFFLLIGFIILLLIKMSEMNIRLIVFEQTLAKISIPITDNKLIKEKPKKPKTS
jgi:hypothetical protein